MFMMIFIHDDPGQTCLFHNIVKRRMKEGMGLSQNLKRSLFRSYCARGLVKSVVFGFIHFRFGQLIWAQTKSFPPQYVKLVPQM